MLINSIINNDNNHKNYNNISKTKIFGFWIYLMSDLILFACLFATYIILAYNTTNYLIRKEIFNLNYILIETLLLLCSSMTYGFVISAMYKQKKNIVKLWLFITFLFGLSFVLMEIYEFYNLIYKGYGPEYNGFLSSFFILVGTHGIHVIFGLMWILIMIIHIYYSGFTDINKTRLKCLSIFWHLLDIIWICVFTFVYLLGVIV